MIERGHVYQMTDAAALDAYCLGEIPVGYIGFDCTARSLHVGSLVQIMNLRRLQQAGGKPIVLMGGGTTKVGDPTDKEKSRPILLSEEIAANMASIRRNFEPFLRFGDGPTDAVMIDNAEWLDDLNYIEFLRDYGKHFTINKMIAQETVARRLRAEEPYTFLEFNYMLLQSYDFLELARSRKCRIQLGGSDQWGNIVNGIDLTRRIIDLQVFGVTTPLITTASGGKMGKTAEGAVWLNAEMRSPFDYWQFWRNTEDADVGRFLRLFTDMPLAEIAELETLKGAGVNEAKKRLADEATALLHGRVAAEEARRAAESTFERGATSQDLPTIEFDFAGPDGVTMRTAEQLLTQSGLAKSLSEARRLIQQQGAQINDTRPEVGQTYTRADVMPGLGAYKVQKGKKSIVLLKPL
ncbi:tyrosine--tRNA ligase [bacterium]|nr:tyrosine--tRNA ligase [bacterium]